MTLEEHLAIVSQVLALRRAGKIPPVWALDGRYRIGWEYDSAVCYSIHGLAALVASNGELEPAKPWFRPKPAPANRAPRPRATLVPRSTSGPEYDAQLLRLAKTTGAQLSPWQLRRVAYLIAKGQTAAAAARGAA